MRVFTTLFTLLTLCSHVSAADTYYVSPEGGTNALGSLLDPFPTIQEGIDAAAPGDIVSAGPGTYQGEGNVHLRFYGKSISLISDSGSEVTTIDGGSLDRIFILMAGDSTNIIIDGFTITGVNTEPQFQIEDDGTLHSIFSTNGSAVICYPGGGARFQSCRFIDNRADTYTHFFTTAHSTETTHSEASDGIGGAIFIMGGDIIISNCLFSGSRAGISGGAISAVSNASLRVYDSQFVDNQSWNYFQFYIIEISGGYESLLSFYYSESMGGAVQLNASTAVFERCHFNSNVSGIGGAVSAHNGSMIFMDESFIENNSAYMNTTNLAGGGGLYIDNSIASVNNSTFSANWGGGIDSLWTMVDINGNDTTQLKSESGNGSGGGIYASNFSELTISNCTFRLNRAAAGGGAVSVFASPLLLITGCLFDRNELLGANLETGGGGGALLIQNVSSNAVIQDCRFTTNRAIRGTEFQLSSVSIDGGSTFLLQSFSASGARGGAVCLRDSSGITMEDIELVANSAGGGGALYAENCENVVITGMLAVSNRAFSGYTETTFEFVSLPFVLLENKVAHQFGAGGAILASNSALSISHGSIKQNFGSWGSAAGLQNCDSALSSLLIVKNMDASSVSIYKTWFDDIPLTDVVTHSNSYAKGLAIDGNQSSMNHLTVLKSGGFFTNATASMFNSIVWSNDWEVDESAVFTSSYSCVLGSTPGEGNILSDPKLDPGGRLISGSPAIDTALPDPAYTHDFEGEGIAGAGADIGADEFVDSDDDGLADAWERDHYPGLADINADSDDDMDGATDFVEYLHGSNPQISKTNGEDIPDGWLIYAGLNPLLPQQDTDHDLDGFITLDEYISDTDPLDPASFLYLTMVTGETPEMEWFAATNRWYSIEESNEPEGLWSVITNSIPGTGGEIRLANLIDTNTVSFPVFFRIKAGLYPD